MGLSENRRELDLELDKIPGAMVGFLRPYVYHLEWTDFWVGNLG
jgi:hypothetical protein